MKKTSFVRLSTFGLSTILFGRKKAVLGTIILTDTCNLKCKHCSVNNINSTMYSYMQIKNEMKQLFDQGIRILIFCGGETFMWYDGDITVRNLVIEAKKMGFLIVNVVTNGTYRIDLPEADLVLVSLDGNKENHNEIRGDTYDLIMKNINESTSENLCFYMAINKINKNSIESVCKAAKDNKNVRAVSFNFHTPYEATEKLSLTREEKQVCCNKISELIDEGYPVFNLRSVFPYIINNNFPVPCHQCLVIENGKIFTCGRCIDEAGLCSKCGYFFVAEFSLIFGGKIKVIKDMIKTYFRYV